MTFFIWFVNLSHKFILTYTQFEKNDRPAFEPPFLVFHIFQFASIFPRAGRKQKQISGKTNLEHFTHIWLVIWSNLILHTSHRTFKHGPAFEPPSPVFSHFSWNIIFSSQIRFQVYYSLIHELYSHYIGMSHLKVDLH